MKFSHCALILCMVLSACNNMKDPKEDSIQKHDREALLLGVYHFNNPGRDTYNLEIDDYFSEKRQAEIKELVNKLADFKPNKIMVEFMPGQQHSMDSLLQLYKEDKISLKEIKGGRNEVYQVGFRLAKQLNAQVIAVDHGGNWLGNYVDFIADTLSLSYYKDHKKAYADKMQQRQKTTDSSTVMDNLLRLNKWEQILENHAYYNNIAVRVKDTAQIIYTYQQIEQEINGEEYYLRSFDFENIGIELVTEWYKRNLFIYRNILENSNSEDRILIIFGSGHIRYLHELLNDNENFELKSVEKFLN